MAGDKLYVALGKELKEGESTLLWALQNILAFSTIVIVHVHRPAQTIHIGGAKFAASQLKDTHLRPYRELEREKVDKILDEYISLCSIAKVRAEKLVIEMDDAQNSKSERPFLPLFGSFFGIHDDKWIVVGKGLVELIALYGIDKLVMGTTKFSKKTKLPKSRTAMIVQKHADPSCKICFVCKGKLICTREAVPNCYRIGLSPIEAESLRREAYDESCRRQKAERDASEASLKANTSESLYKKELKRRKKIEETLAGEKMEVEKLKIERDRVFEELQKAHEHELALELRIADSDCFVKDLEDKLLAAQQKLDELLRERVDLLRESEELRRRKEEVTTNTHRGMNFSVFSYSELKQATNNFADSMKIGEGGYGSVYKGFLHHTMVAIKMLNPESMQGQTEFYQEVDVLSRVRHPHLVTLIGACPEAWALVYESCTNGSLEDRLACKDNTPLTWQVRTRITAEMCSALIFLHSNKPHSVVHGDLKPANILIDANFTSKIGDFGICRILNQSNTTTLYCRTDPKGTFVYMDPEFLASGVMTASSDVFSFGVILLRLLTGRPALGIIGEVQEALKEERLHEILDPTAGEWPFVQAMQLAHLALKCCEEKRKQRPNLAVDAWKVLEPMTRAATAGSSSLSFGPASEDSSCIPSYFICPIFQEIMMDPHIAADGFTYEAEALKGWLDSGHDTSPMTNLKLARCDLIPNHALRSAIQEWLQQHN